VCDASFFQPNVLLKSFATKEAVPTSRVQQVFEEVSRLPRRQQEKIVEFVTAFVRQYEQAQK
jgi:hypothetical protein